MFCVCLWSVYSLRVICMCVFLCVFSFSVLYVFVIYFRLYDIVCVYHLFVFISSRVS